MSSNLQRFTQAHAVAIPAPRSKAAADSGTCGNGSGDEQRPALANRPAVPPPSASEPVRNDGAVELGYRFSSHAEMEHAVLCLEQRARGQPKMEQRRLQAELEEEFQRQRFDSNACVRPAIPADDRSPCSDAVRNLRHRDEVKRTQMLPFGATRNTAEAFFQLLVHQPLFDSGSCIIVPYLTHDFFTEFPDDALSGCYNSAFRAEAAVVLLLGNLPRNVTREQIFFLVWVFTGVHVSAIWLHHNADNEDRFARIKASRGSNSGGGNGPNSGQPLSDATSAWVEVPADKAALVKRALHKRVLVDRVGLLYNKRGAYWTRVFRAAVELRKRVAAARCQEMPYDTVTCVDVVRRDSGPSAASAAAAAATSTEAAAAALSNPSDPLCPCCDQDGAMQLLDDDIYAHVEDYMRTWARGCWDVCGTHAMSVHSNVSVNGAPPVVPDVVTRAICGSNKGFRAHWAEHLARGLGPHACDAHVGNVAGACELRAAEADWDRLQKRLRESRKRW